MKTNNDNMHNFFTEAKNMLGVSGKTDNMEHSIWREVMRLAKKLARAYVEEVTNAEPSPDIHYEITWGHENNDKIDGVWKDTILLENKWTGLYFKNLGDNDQCDEFEYIKEIKKVID